MWRKARSASRGHELLPEMDANGGWANLPRHLLDGVKRSLGPADWHCLRLLRAARLVNRHWSAWATSATVYLEPSPRGVKTDVCMAKMVDAFPSVRGLRHRFRQKITDRDLRRMAMWTQLTELDIGGCWHGESLTDGLSALSGVSALSKLGMGHCCRVTAGVLEALGNLRELTWLDMGASWELTNKRLGGLSCLTGLTWLELGCLVRSRNRVTDEGMSCLHGLTNLKHLSFQGGCLMDGGLMHIAGLSRLRSLCLLGTCVTGWGLGQLMDLDQLTAIDLSQSAVGDRGLGFLTTFQALARIDLEGTWVSGEGFRHLETLTSLKRVGLRGCRPVGANRRGLKHLVERTSITDLDLGECRNVRDEDLKDLVKLTALSSVSLAGTRLTDRGLTRLLALGALRRLSVHRCNVTREGVEALRGALPELEVRGFRFRPYPRVCKLVMQCFNAVPAVM